MASTLSSIRTHTRGLIWLMGQLGDQGRCVRLTLRSTRSRPRNRQLHAAPRGPMPTPAQRSARKQPRRTRDALRGGERRRARPSQLLCVFRGQLQRGVVQVDRQLQLLARRQLRRLRRLHDRPGSGHMVGLM